MSSDPSSPLLLPAATTSASSPLTRDYRKGNWTLQETLVLIDAKRLDDERRADSKLHCSSPSGGGGGGGRAAELRWKWVENYCWKNGCLRSQNQCNDKWDNLLRDYKKVRDYDGGGGGGGTAYWAMEKHERKERNLPANLSSEVFEALTDVLGRRNANRVGVGGGGGGSMSFRSPAVAALPPSPPTIAVAVPQEQQEQRPRVEVAAVAAPPPPVPTLQAPANHPTSVCAVEMSESSGTDCADRLEPDPKRRKVRSVGSSVVHGASVLARTLLACEEKRDQRHRDLLGLQERRLRLESDRAEVSRQGIAGLIDAVNGLSGAIHAFVSHEPRNGDAR